LKSGFVILTLALIGGTVAVVWHGCVAWRRAEAQRAKLHVPVKPEPVPVLAPAPKREAPQAIQYADIANKNLFSKDRNPNVVIEPPKGEEAKKMPSLPVVYGVLGLPSGVQALMAVKTGEPSRPVRAGDTIGEFKIVALDTRNIAFDWNGERISRPVDELIDRSAQVQMAVNAPAAAAPAATAPPAAAQTGLAPVASAPPQNATANAATNPKIGKEVGAAGASVRACVPGDTSPAGTVVEGYRKQIVPTPFGDQCSWIPAK